MSEPRKPITFRKDVYDAYSNFVNTARLVNKKFYVYEEIKYIFELGTTLLNLRLQRSMGGGGTQTDTQRSIYDEMKEAECISYIQQSYLDYGKIDPETFKLPLQVFRGTIQDFLGIRDKEAVNARKIAILKALELKQIQEGSNHFIVHRNYRSVSQEQKAAELDFNNVVEGIKKSYNKKLYDTRVKSILGSQEKYLSFQQYCIDYNIVMKRDEENSVYFEYQGEILKNKNSDAEKEFENIFSNFKVEAEEE